MTDPYKVLGVSPNASDDEVKAAYREMARKYHPDNYVNNPLADLASEKMKEINEAYDAISKMRKGGGGHSSSQNGTYGPGGGGYASGGTQFADIRRMIQNGRTEDAAELLDGVPGNRRDAEWYFLKGSVLYTRGWLDQAYQHTAQAVNLDPGNAEYRAALNQMSWQRNNGSNQTGPYRSAGQPTVMGGCSCCDICTGLMCMDCCCDSLGGCC